MTSLLATNDFPPKIGGIQTYLHELWRRLPADATTVFTTRHPEAAAWDASQPFRVERAPHGFLVPTRAMAQRVDALATEVDADIVFLDPMLPLGNVGPRLRRAPYVVVAHGAEITVYGRVPGSAAVARRVLRGAVGVVVAGEYVAGMVARVAGRPVPTLAVPPGVDPARFTPADEDARHATRARFGLDRDRPLVLGVSRLVPRKGFDVLIDAVAGLDGVQVAIAGTGRDAVRLARRVRRRGGEELASRVHLLGRVSDADLPALYGSADVFAMLCRERWGGLEAEGFGIVFLEAAACGVPAIAGRSGGAHEAVVDGETGLVVDPRDVGAVRDAIADLLGDDGARRRMGQAALARARSEFSYDTLAARLAPLAAGDLSVLA
ncbi:MAG TPA: glycosyltransferase family 4 protein [Acidimicrobiia bacterium]|nr:glycosyltransferase family 4 protein [Acidimicrobiia bacterium]